MNKAELVAAVAEKTNPNARIKHNAFFKILIIFHL